MKLLLDTHAFLWWTADDKALSRLARDAIGEQANTIFLSVVSIWEMGIKKSMNRLQMPENIEEEIERRRISALPVKVAHAVIATQLPKIHGDPFDRMLISQAQIEGLTIITRDRAFAKYDVKLLKA